MTEVASTFRKLHFSSRPLILPNAWDAGSAVLFESQGAKAIATTSAGISWSLGYADGRKLPIGELAGAVGRIVGAVKVPVSVDIENGYAHDAQSVAENVMRLVYKGIQGINIEDGTDSPGILSRKIGAIRDAAARAGVDLFINVRSDVFLEPLVDDVNLVRESIRRGTFYAEAGADGLFLPGIVLDADIKEVATAVALPLNVMAWPGLSGIHDLAELGVRRLSAGAALSQASWATAERLSEAFLRTGQSDPFFEPNVSSGVLQRLFSTK